MYSGVKQDEESDFISVSSFMSYKSLRVKVQLLVLDDGVSGTSPALARHSSVVSRLCEFYILPTLDV